MPVGKFSVISDPDEGTMGYLMLQGGAEFGGEMKRSDLRAIELAGGPQAPICIIAAAASPDNNHLRAGRNGQQWFFSLGAQHVTVAAVIDRSTADDPETAQQLQHSRLIYMLGGFPAYLAQCLRGTRCWTAMLASLDQGAVLAGSSAGAMVLCEHLYNPQGKTVMQGLGLLPGCCILPHHNTFGQQWAPRLQKELPGATLIGIDEQTGMINDGPRGAWRVRGLGAVWVYSDKRLERLPEDATFSF
jgi:cyanophycinase